MADFSKAITKVLKIEGGYVDDPTDRGGETKYGISKRAFPDEDIPGLTVGKAMKLYRKHYWDTIHLDDDRIPQAVAEELFDSAVNMGSFWSAQALQRALNLLIRGNLWVDGIIGSKSLSELHAYVSKGPVETSVLVKLLNGLQLNQYLAIVEHNPEQRKFFKGWLNKRVQFNGL